jgi:hypothetical protein
MSKRPKPKRKGKAGRPPERLPHIPDIQEAIDKLLRKKP